MVDIIMVDVDGPAAKKLYNDIKTQLDGNAEVRLIR